MCVCSAAAAVAEEADERISLGSAASGMKKIRLDGSPLTVFERNAAREAQTVASLKELDRSAEQVREI